MTVHSSARFAIRSTRVVTPGGCVPAIIVIHDQTIQSVLPYDASLPTAVRVMEVGKAAILPGVVDTHVHINDPDGGTRVGWEGFESATRAAAAGGITTLVDMPLNSTPVTTTVAALEVKRAAFRRMGGGHVDVGFHAGLVRGNAGEIEGLLDAGVLGVKAFLVHSGIDDFPAAREEDLRAVMPLLARRDVPLLAHAEVDEVSCGVLPNEDVRSYARYVASRPAQWEVAAIEMLIRLAKEYRCPVHVVHLATEEALGMLRTARAAGVPITVETCPHYLHFAAETIPDGATQYKCAPPIRGAKTRAALWQALRDGEIDMIASDHSPCPPELKLMETGNFAKAWGGISALQLMLSVVNTDAGDVGLVRIAEWLCGFPAKLARLDQKGSIAVGKDADLVVLDPEGTWKVKGEELHHRHKVTPYEGEVLRGVVRQTYLRGTLVVDQGKFVAMHQGKLLAREGSGHVGD
jgi:allantoinase